MHVHVYKIYNAWASIEGLILEHKLFIPRRPRVTIYIHLIINFTDLKTTFSSKKLGTNLNTIRYRMVFGVTRMDPKDVVTKVVQ